MHTSIYYVLFLCGFVSGHFTFYSSLFRLFLCSFVQGPGLIPVFCCSDTVPGQRSPAPSRSWFRATPWSCLNFELEWWGHLLFEQDDFALLGVCCDSLGNGDKWDVKWRSMYLTLKLEFMEFELIHEYAKA